jgi:hypothetical protein
MMCARMLKPHNANGKSGGGKGGGLVGWLDRNFARLERGYQRWLRSSLATISVTLLFTVLVTAGLYVVPFAGIAFMWHMSAARALVEALPGPTPDLPRWLQLASGLVFVCMLFAGTAAVGAVALLTVFSSADLPAPGVARALTSVGYGLVFVFGVRAAGMFMITTTTLTHKRGLMPRWVALLSYLAAGFLLVSTTFHPAILLVFPGWVLVFSACLVLPVRRATARTATSKETR